jgi:hypothetical protein
MSWTLENSQNTICHFNVTQMECAHIKSHDIYSRKLLRKNQPIIDLLFPLTKLSQANQPTGLGKVSLRHSTLGTSQFITHNPWAMCHMQPLLT